MRTLRCALLVLAIFSLLPAAVVHASVDRVKESGKIAIDEDVWNSCTGEYVHLTGTMLWSNHVVETNPGILKWNFQYRYQGVSGVGQTSGLKYQANSGDHGYGTTITGDALPYHYAAGGFSTIRLIAQGKSPDLVIKHKITVTVTPDFVFRVFKEVDESSCK